MLKTHYGMVIDRKTVRRNILDLIDCGFEINYRETARQSNASMDGESNIMSDFYLEHDFTDGELRLLIDSILFSKHIPRNQRTELIKKLENLTSVHFSSRVKHICTVPDSLSNNQQMFMTIEAIDEAINLNRKVAFNYNTFNSELALSPRLDAQGNIRTYIMNPYQIAALNGRYYLICNNDKYDTVSNYRIDRISGISILDEPRKPMAEVKGLENGFDLPKHMAEHIYMYSGESDIVVFKLKKEMISEMLDWFGRGISITDRDDDSVTVRVTVNLAAMRKWALQFALYVEIIEPVSLRDEVIEDIRRAAVNYGITASDLA